MSLLSFLVPAALACGGGCATPATGAETPASAPTSSTVPAAATSSTTTLHVEGMTCSSCAVAIKTALGKLDGVESTVVDVDGKKATVTYDASKVTPAAIAQKVTDLGYPSTVEG